jgi:DNA-binding response OmpR family regulator
MGYPQTRVRILLVEDEAATRRLVSRALADEGFEIVSAGQGEAATRALREGGVGAVVLDLWLPDGSGIELCRQWRAQGIDVPILMLTARTDVASRVSGLDAGADDYLGKPFALSELRARLRALLRRGKLPLEERLLVRGELTVDFGRRRARLRGSEVPLTRREFEVLERLAWGKGHAVARADLLEEIWGEASAETAASLEVIVARLRRKLEAKGRHLIRTVRGYGYAVADPSDRGAP